MASTTTRPTTRQEFKEWCLRALGHPQIRVNVPDQQTEDRISDALALWRYWHMNAVERIYIKRPITQEEKNNHYLIIPESDHIIEVVKIVNPGLSHVGSELFNVRYRIYMDELFASMSSSIVPYYIARQHLELLDDIFADRYTFRFNRYSNKLYIDTQWVDISVGDTMVIEAYRYVEENPIWSDYWLSRYATALIKRQWGQNVGKFGVVNLMGGVTIDGPRIYNEALEEIKTLEGELKFAYSEPPLPFFG